MQIRELAVPDAYVLDLVPHGDARGRFTEWYRADVLAEATGFGLTLAQANHSVSARGALRGVHFALVPFEQGLAETVEWYRENRDWWEPLKAGAVAR